MKTVLLMRHAKSSWDMAGMDDHDRPLNARGREAADTMARWLVSRSLVPDHALVSTAARTVETWRRLAAILPDAPKADFHRSLYHSGPDTMLDLLRACPPGAQRVILIAHQPGMSATAARLSDGMTSPETASAFSHYPTAAIAVMEADTDSWAELAPNECRFTEFAIPRQITLS